MILDFAVYLEKTNTHAHHVQYDLSLIAHTHTSVSFGTSAQPLMNKPKSCRSRTEAVRYLVKKTCNLTSQPTNYVFFGGLNGTLTTRILKIFPFPSHNNHSITDRYLCFLCKTSM